MAARPVERERGSLDLAQRMKARLAVQKAHVAAMEIVLPAFTDFYASLSDAQKAALEPRRRYRRDVGDISRPEWRGFPDAVARPVLLPDR
jgi:hypothetical protein